MEKDYKDLKFTDDFMFCKVLSTNPDLCRELLALILKKDVKKIRLPEKQKPIEITSDGKGIRLDVYIEDDDTDSTINKLPDLFPLGMSTSYNKNTTETLKTGLRHLCSEGTLNHADIAKALHDGFGKINVLLHEIKEKMTSVSDDKYENYCDKFFTRDLDLAYQAAERNYSSWKEEHEWNSLQSLEDKRTQEIVRLLSSCVIFHSFSPTNREINDCPLKIQEDALEYDTQLPDNIDLECARLARFITMKQSIMWLDYAKLGKYLYKHYKELNFEDELKLKEFQVMLDFIHKDMSVLNPKLIKHLPWYEENKQEETLDNVVYIINTCKPYCNEKIQQDFLETYIRDALRGDVKQEMQKILERRAVYTNICKLLGMLKSSMKIFKVGTTSVQLASCLSPLTDKPNKDSMIRKIDEGAADTKSKIRIWTDTYIKEHCYTKGERLFLGLSGK